MKKLVPTLFILGITLLFTAIIAMPHGWPRQTVLFLGLVLGIVGMVLRIALVMRNQ